MSANEVGGEVAHRSLMRIERGAWCMEILNPADQRQYDVLHATLTRVLGLDWVTNVGAPDGIEVADDCAAALWDAGFRVTPAASSGAGA